MAIQNTNASLQMSAKAKSFITAANSDNMAGMRMAAPVVNSVSQIKMAKDVFQGSRLSANAGIEGLGAVTGRFSGAFGGIFQSIGKALKANFLTSALLSGISNVYELATGKVKPMQAVGNFVADTAAYTAIGAAATTVGGFLGSLIPIPFVGTAIGIGIGLLAGKLYEDLVRAKFSNTVAQSIQSLTTSSTSAPVPTAPSQTPAYPPAQ